MLKVFWGRKRWARKKLREVTKKNHNGVELGLYRAKVTRFAGKYREMSRMLRCKADLQEICVSSRYAAQGQSVRREKDRVDDEEGLSPHSFQEAKMILLDENFWRSIVAILRVSLPLVKILRMLDGNKPVLGKVYDRMFMYGETLKKMKGVPWLSQVIRIHESRWEYLHSDFHSAAYALDPEFFQLKGNLTMLHEMAFKMSLKNSLCVMLY